MPSSTLDPAPYPQGAGFARTAAPPERNHRDTLLAFDVGCNDCMDTDGYTILQKNMEKKIFSPILHLVALFTHLLFPCVTRATRCDPTFSADGVHHKSQRRHRLAVTKPLSLASVELMENCPWVSLPVSPTDSCPGEAGGIRSPGHHHLSSINWTPLSGFQRVGPHPLVSC